MGIDPHVCCADMSCSAQPITESLNHHLPKKEATLSGALSSHAPQKDATRSAALTIPCEVAAFAGAARISRCARASTFVSRRTATFSPAPPLASHPLPERDFVLTDGPTHLPNDTRAAAKHDCLRVSLFSLMHHLWRFTPTTSLKTLGQQLSTIRLRAFHPPFLERENYVLTASRPESPTSLLPL